MCVYIEIEIHTYEYCALCAAAYVHSVLLSCSQIEVNTQPFVNTKDDQSYTTRRLLLTMICIFSYVCSVYVQPASHTAKFVRESRLYRNKVTNIQPFSTHTHIIIRIHLFDVRSFVRFVNKHFEYSRYVDPPHTRSRLIIIMYTVQNTTSMRSEKLYLKYAQKLKANEKTTKLTKVSRRMKLNEIGQSN